MILYLFMLVGGVVFLICIAIAPVRRYALSAALWCVICGPCLVAALLIAGTAIATAMFVASKGALHTLHAPRIVSTVGWLYALTTIAVTAAVATATAWLHQAIIHRFTFALFRLYATAVSAGIGSVFGWVLCFLLMWRGVRSPIWIPGMLLLMGAFGALGYRWSRSLRGRHAPKFTWVTAEEFYGPNQHLNLH